MSDYSDEVMKPENMENSGPPAKNLRKNSGRVIIEAIEENGQTPKTQRRRAKSERNRLSKDNSNSNNKAQGTQMQRWLGQASGVESSVESAGEHGFTNMDDHDKNHMYDQVLAGNELSNVQENWSEGERSGPDSELYTSFSASDTDVEGSLDLNITVKENRKEEEARLIRSWGQYGSSQVSRDNEKHGVL